MNATVLKPQNTQAYNHANLQAPSHHRASRTRCRGLEATRNFMASWQSNTLDPLSLLASSKLQPRAAQQQRSHGSEAQRWVQAQATGASRCQG